jgi:tetratricopeptide (TPR) repeat protein
VSLSLCDYRLNEYTNAISILQQAETLSLRIGYKEGLVDVYLQLSIIYDDFMTLSKAEDYAVKAFSIIDEDRNAFQYRRIAHAYKTLASVQYSLHQYQTCRYEVFFMTNYALTLEQL